MKRTISLLIALGLSISLSATKPIDIEKIESFLDGVILSKLSDKNISGASMVMVDAEKVLLSKGYGYSDWGNRIPVNPSESLFRIGSVSKLFVWISVMQQVERGNLDLDRDINEYLKDFKIPSTFPDPITLRHLMSHTPGFEDKLVRLFSYDSTLVRPLRELLPNEIPKRVRPSGVQASYSNHGTAIAAHIVEIVSGLEWNEYVETNIFQPLDMFSTTFRQPLPKVLEHSMSKGYSHVSGQMVEKPFEYIPLAPAGSVSTSATDMAKFMIMLLNWGSLGDFRIVEQETIEGMLEPVITHAPGVNPCIHGFMDLSRKGLKIFGHGGDTFWFHTLLAILPEQGLGFFISFNSEGGGGTYLEVLDLLLDEFLVENDSLKATISLTDEYLEAFVGEYKFNRHPHSDFLKVLSIMNRIEVKADGGRLAISDGKKTEYWLPTDSLTFRKEFDNEFIRFELDDSRGKARYAFISSLAIIAFERVGFFDTRVLHIAILALAFILSLIAIVHWPMVFIIRRRFQPMGNVPKPIPLVSKLIIWFSSLLLLTFYVGLVLSTSSPEAVVFSIPAGLKYLLAIPFLLIPLQLVGFYKTILVWPLIATRLWSKTFYTMVCLSQILALWQLYYWNLIGWNY